ncbi:MAG: hypothetical protein WBD56_13230 [Anaerolineales bacterium]
MSKTSHHVERGFWLSLVLILIMIHSIFSIWFVYNAQQDPNAMTTPWLIGALVLVAIAKFFAAIAIWNWKKWGLYLFAVSVVVSVIIGLMLTGWWLIVFNEVLPLAILGWLIRDKWSNFGINT